MAFRRVPAPIQPWFLLSTLTSVENYWHANSGRQSDSKQYARSLSCIRNKSIVPFFHQVFLTGLICSCTSKINFLDQLTQRRQHFLAQYRFPTYWLTLFTLLWSDSTWQWCSFTDVMLRHTTHSTSTIRYYWRQVLLKLHKITNWNFSQN